MEIRSKIALVLAKEGLADDYLAIFSPVIEDLDSDFVSLEENNYLRRINGKYLITDTGLAKLTKKADNREVILAEELRNLFPVGKKNGTWLWKGTQMSVANKLRPFFKKYPQYTNEDIINATKSYINSFDGKDIHSSMSLLIYFIEKNGHSILLEQLENKEEVQGIRRGKNLN